MTLFTDKSYQKPLKKLMDASSGSGDGLESNDSWHMSKWTNSWRVSTWNTESLDDKVESVHRHELVDELHLSELVHLSGSEQPQSINRTTKPPLLSSTAVLTLPFRPQRPIFDIESFEKNNSSEANTDVSQSCTSSQLLLQTSRGSYICISFLL